jgi:hypothetical protein
VAAVFTALPIILESHRINSNFLSGSILLVAILASQSQDAVIARVRRLRRQPDGIRELTTADGGPVPDEVPHTVVAAVTGGKHREVDLRGPQPRRSLVGTDIRVTFGGVKAVDGVNVDVGPGQRVAIIGANGAACGTSLPPGLRSPRRRRASS